MSFDEAYETVEGQVELNASYLVLMVSSGVLAAVALLTNSVPVLIGSMAIAPALAPLELVAFGAVRRRRRPVAYGVLTAVVGLAVATIGAIVTTMLLNATGVLPADANLLRKPLLEERVRPGWYSVAAAIAAGVAGSVATVQNRPDVVVGVVAAVALVPAAAAGGITLLSRDPVLATGGFTLVTVNVVMIVLTGIATLLILRPERETPSSTD